MECPSSERMCVVHEGAAVARPPAKVALAVRILVMQCKCVVFRHLKEGMTEWYRVVALQSHVDTAVQTYDLSSPDCSESADRDSGAEPTSSSQGTPEETQVHDANPLAGTRSSCSTCSKTKRPKKEGTNTSRHRSKYKSRRQRGEKQKPA